MGNDKLYWISLQMLSCTTNHDVFGYIPDKTHMIPSPSPGNEAQAQPPPASTLKQNTQDHGIKPIVGH